MMHPRSLMAITAVFLCLISLVSAQASQHPPSDPYSWQVSHGACVSRRLWKFANHSCHSSASKPCKLGCCSKYGVCGLGPDFCGGTNCTSSCDQKSECDPGWGAQWSTKQKCPLNVCCSKFGFCGTTKDFCGTATVKKPSSGGSSSNQRTIGGH